MKSSYRVLKFEVTGNDRGAAGMNRPDTIYTSILTADYDTEQDAFDVTVRYREALPRYPPTKMAFGIYPVGGLVARLEHGNRETAFTDYSVRPNLTVDEMLRAEYDDPDGDIMHWMTWLEDEGHGEFVRVLRETTKEGGEAYLLAHQDDVSDAAIEEAVQSYLHDLREERERWWGSGGYLRSH